MPPPTSAGKSCPRPCPRSCGRSTTCAPCPSARTTRSRWCGDTTRASRLGRWCRCTGRNT
uniref:Putative ribosomal protein L26 variant 2 n=1 Tax=Taeniopygia guttata TaxID=59729 RepID=B5G064_TAEGU|nr:ribosomal protein uL24-like [Taeniopygia guttata]ACH44675.1 putative ribosomal protein L26 variant 2 [Taeniopygia guttata]